jgi:hypothetical protein
MSEPKLKISKFRYKRTQIPKSKTNTQIQVKSDKQKEVSKTATQIDLTKGKKYKSEFKENPKEEEITDDLDMMILSHLVCEDELDKEQDGVTLQYVLRLSKVKLG